MKRAIIVLGLIILLMTLSNCSDLLTAPQENENTRPETSFSFGLNDDSNVLLYITNYNYELVIILVDEEMQAGYYNVSWDGKDYNGNQVVSGVYYYFLVTDGYAAGNLMMLLK
jgi:flagellar hook assembly protein FlgD